MQAYLLNIDTVLLTPRTLARRFRENDGPLFYELTQNNSALLSDHFPHTLNQVRDPESAEYFVREKLANWLQQQEYCFGIWESEEAKLIGYISLTSLDWHLPEARLTFFIDQSYSSQGIMTEVLLHLLSFAFEQLRLERIYMRLAQDNYPAQRLARKCAFRREGDLRNAFRRPSGDFFDVMLMALTRAEYEKA